MADTPFLVDTVETGRRLGCGRTTVYKLIKLGALESVKVAGLRKVPVDAIEDYVRSLRGGHAPGSAAA